MRKNQGLVQFSIRATPEFNEKLNFWAKKIGISKGALVQMCISAGLGNIIRAISPEDAVTPEFMAKIVQEYQKNEASASEKQLPASRVPSD
jgi:predicted DNA-binding protein